MNLCPNSRETVTAMAPLGWDGTKLPSRTSNAETKSSCLCDLRLEVPTFERQGCCSLLVFKKELHYWRFRESTCWLAVSRVIGSKPWYQDL